VRSSVERRAAGRSTTTCRSLLLAVDVTQAAEFNSTAAKREEAVEEREATGPDAGWGIENSDQTGSTGSSREVPGTWKDRRALTVDSSTGDGWASGKDLGVLVEVGSIHGRAAAAKRLHTSNALTGPLAATTCKARPRGDLCIHPPPYLQQAAFFCGRVPGSCDLWSAFTRRWRTMSSLILWFVRHCEEIPESLVLLVTSLQRQHTIFVKSHGGDSHMGPQFRPR
jgi:hypothetical protein